MHRILGTTPFAVHVAKLRLTYSARMGASAPDVLKIMVGIAAGTCWREALARDLQWLAGTVRDKTDSMPWPDGEDAIKQWIQLAGTPGWHAIAELFARRAAQH